MRLISPNSGIRSRKALPFENAQLYFRNSQPASVLWRVVDFKPLRLMRKASAAGNAS